MTTRELYRKHKAGEVGRDRFLYEVRRDKNLPWVTNITSYDDAVKILKNKGIISEADVSENYEVHYSDGIRQAKKFKDINQAMSFAKSLVNTNDKLQHVDIFKAGPNFNSTADTDSVIAWWGDGSFMDNKSKNDPKLAAKKMSLNEADANITTDPAVDRVNPYFLKKGVEKLLSKETELTNDSYKKALNKAAKQLQKNPHAFDKEMFANVDDVDKADAKLETEEVKKANHKDKKNEMKKVKVKALKEAALEALTDSLKKKESINEDSHWKHTVGSEVHTPDGKGKVIEIVGGTLTVEMDDGRLVDVQINTVDHHTQEAQEAEPAKADPSKDDVKDMWAKWDKEGHKPFAGMVTDPEHFKKPLDLSKIKEYIAKNKDDKEKMNKLKEAIKKLKEVKALVVPKTATGMQIDKLAQADPSIKPGQQIDIIRK